MQQKELLSILQTAPLFANVERDVLARILDARGVTLQESAPGEMLRSGNAPALGILLKGRAAILSADEEKNLILREMTKGEIFDAASLFLKDPPPLSRIVAKTACTALFLDADAVRNLMTSSPAFLDAYLSFLADRVQFLNAKIRCYTAGSAERRLALFLADGDGETYTRTVSLSALSRVLDIGRASLYRALEKLEQDALILHNGRRITVISKTKLLEKYQ